MTATASSGVAAGVASTTRSPSKRARRAKPKVPAEPGRARIIAIANQKGGVGKSTTAVSLGAALADLGYRVLVLDLDPQGNASTGMGIRHEARDVTVYDVVVGDALIDDATVPTPVERLFAVPSTIDLAGAEIELVSQFSREARLKRAIEAVRDGRYDFILLDCPPSLGLLTVNALTAAEELIVPIQCEYYALEGLGQLLRNVSLVQQNINPDLRVAGIVMTMFDPRTKLSEQVVAEVRRFFGDLVYDVIIPRTVRLSEAPGYGQPITLYDPRSKGAEAYRELAREVAVRPAPEAPIPAMDDLPTVVVPPPTAGPAPADDGDEEADIEGVPTVSDVEARRAPTPEETPAPDPPPSPPTMVQEAPPAEPQREPAAPSDRRSPRPTEVAGAPPATSAPAADVRVDEDEVWEEEPEAREPPRVRPVGKGPDGATPDPRRVVVIDEDQGFDVRPDAAPAVDPAGAPPPTDIGATLHDDPEAGKRRWRLFRKGGED